MSDVLGLERRIEFARTRGPEQLPLLQTCRDVAVGQAGDLELREGGDGIGAKHAAVLATLRNLPGLSGYRITAEVRLLVFLGKHSCALVTCCSMCGSAPWLRRLPTCVHPAS